MRVRIYLEKRGAFFDDSRYELRHANARLLVVLAKAADRGEETHQNVCTRAHHHHAVRALRAHL